MHCHPQDVSEAAGGAQKAVKGIRSAFRRTRSRTEVSKSGSQWTAPSYFNMVVGGGTSSIQWGEPSLKGFWKIVNECGEIVQKLPTAKCLDTGLIGFPAADAPHSTSNPRIKLVTARPEPASAAVIQWQGRWRLWMPVQPGAADLSGDPAGAVHSPSYRHHPEPSSMQLHTQQC